MNDEITEDIIILFHEGVEAEIGSFDVVCKKALYGKVRKMKEFRGDLPKFYQSYCAYADYFTKKHPNYIFMGSEDFEHNPEISVNVIFALMLFVRRVLNYGYSVRVLYVKEYTKEEY